MYRYYIHKPIPAHPSGNPINQWHILYYLLASRIWFAKNDSFVCLSTHPQIPRSIKSKKPITILVRLATVISFCSHSHRPNRTATDRICKSLTLPMGYSNGVRTSLQLLGAHSEKIVRGARKENGRRLHLRACIACVCASPHGEPCWRHVATPVRRRLPTWRPAGRDGDGGSRCALRGQSETAPLVLSAALLGWLRAGQ